MASLVAYCSNRPQRYIKDTAYYSVADYWYEERIGPLGGIQLSRKFDCVGLGFKGKFSLRKQPNDGYRNGNVPFQDDKDSAPSMKWSASSARGSGDTENPRPECLIHQLACSLARLHLFITFA